MKGFIPRLCVSILLVLSSLALFAQEKTLSYYNTHENEILPDAQSAFRGGNYERSIELCRWHYAILGDNNSAESLRDKAERCAQLAREMNALSSSGRLKDAKLKAIDILAINPDDPAAKEILLIDDPLSPAPDTVVVEPPVVGLPEEQPVEQIEEVATPPAEEKPVEAIEEEITVPVQTPIEETPYVPAIAEPVQTPAAVDVQNEPRTRFVIKAGAAVIDLKQVPQTIAPGGAIGAYDLGGSRFGGEIGAYVCPGLSASSVSMLGIDAALVLRATKNLYPKLGAGYFSCKSTDENASTTSGMCAIAALNFLLGGHFCLELGAKYYPEVFVQGTKKITTTLGATYMFPDAKLIISDGIAPFVSIGWAF